MKCIAPGCELAAEPGQPFCKTCQTAPAGKRGGWLSAFARKQKRGTGVELDASSIARRLWVGGKPPLDRELPFDVLALCAVEIQPEQLGFRGQVVRCPIHDNGQPPTPREVKLALDAGRAVAASLVTGKTVLVTCHMGLNRSALVAGLGLGLVTRMTGDQIVELIRERRSHLALGNPHFVAMLERYVPGPRYRARATGNR